MGIPWLRWKPKPKPEAEGEERPARPARPARPVRPVPDFEERLGALLGAPGPEPEPEPVPESEPQPGTGPAAPIAPAPVRGALRARWTALAAAVRRSWRDDKAAWLVFLVLLVVLLWRLGSFPARFNDAVGHMILSQVDRLFEGIDPARTVSWFWTAMYTHQAFTSPLYGFFVDLGLRIFGLTLLGVRLPFVLLEFGALVLAWTALRRYLPKALVLVFLLLLALSPWHLLIARSGGIFALSAALYLAAVSLPLLLADRDRSIGLAIAAGLAAGLMPYGYAVLRVVAPTVVFLVFYATARFRRSNYFAYMATVLIAVGMQLFAPYDAFKQYFNARGEGLNEIAKRADDSIDWSIVFAKILENAGELQRQLLGGNDPKHFLSANLAANFYSGDVVLYPKFLVPFLLIGLGVLTYQWIAKRKAFPALVLVFFAVGLVPGLLVGTGNVNLSRDTALLVPLYLVLAVGVYHSFRFLHGLVGRKNPRLLPALLAAFLIATSVLQVSNYFGYAKDGVQIEQPQEKVWRDVIQRFVREHPDGLVLYQEADVFGIYDYTTIDWIGQDEIRSLLADGRLTFLRRDNESYVRKRLQAGQFDLIVTMDPTDLERIFPEVQAYYADRVERYAVYTADPALKADFFLPTPTPSPSPEPTAAG